jgi:DNA-binding winged helix-turn-helix (wHTH) protein
VASSIVDRKPLALPDKPSIAPNPTDGEISFGSFRLRPSQQLLLDDDKPTPIGGRALDILIALVERAGDVVTKDELISRAWPSLAIEEGNLRTQMAIIRRALRDGEAGARYIATVPGRGYRFVSPVSRSARPETSAADEPVSQPASQIPTRLTRVIGRADRGRSAGRRDPRRNRLRAARRRSPGQRHDRAPRCHA